MNLAQSERAAPRRPLRHPRPRPAHPVRGLGHRGPARPPAGPGAQPAGRRGGRCVTPLQGWTEKVAAGYAKQPWTELIEEYRSGPPAWNPMGWGKLDELTNGGEMFIHHEDARRGQAGLGAAGVRRRRPPPRWTRWSAPDCPSSRCASRRSASSPQLPSGRTITLKAGEPVGHDHRRARRDLLWLAGRDAGRGRIDRRRAGGRDPERGPSGAL